ncbi:Sec-C motif domain protein [Tenacibaculum sp. 190130A14a]|uniref:SEC-C motif domain protein n=2 Tax=Tenacibaculum polynesiense TaxID=3137857 RepID=A0ABM9PFY6_9FLAO
MQCPCNPNKKYIDCCKIAHTNIDDVTTAEQLMRSRYSAFVLADIAYLQKSHHTTTRPNKREKKEILQWTKSVQWLKLEVLNTSKGGSNDIIGTVEFKAYFIENGQIDIIHENSTFSKENNHWVYVTAKK